MPRTPHVGGDICGVAVTEQCAGDQRYLAGSYGLNAAMQLAQTEKAGSFEIGESNLDEDVGRD